MAGTTKATYHIHERETIGQALADARGREPVLGSASGVIGILPEGGGTQYIPMFKDTLPTDGNVPCFSSTGNLLDVGDGEVKIEPGNGDGVVVGAAKLGTATLEVCGWFDADYLLQSWYNQSGDVRAELGLDSAGSAYLTLYGFDDVPHTIDADVIGTLVGSSVKWDAAYAHISESGASHTYIDQDMQTTAAPSWAGGTFTNTLKAAAGTYSGNLDIAGDINVGGTYSASDTPGISGTFYSSTGTISLKNGLVVQLTP